MKLRHRVILQGPQGRGIKVNKYGKTPFSDVTTQVQSRQVEKVEERLQAHQAFVQAKGLAALPRAMHATNGLLRPYGGNPMVRVHSRHRPVASNHTAHAQNVGSGSQMYTSDDECHHQIGSSPECVLFLV